MDHHAPRADAPYQHPHHRTSPPQHPAGQTVLQRQLRAGAPARRATALDAFALAKRRFLRGQRVDMGGLSDELGVNRATLYRWVGTREQLLVEILWSLAERTLSDELKKVEAEDGAGNRVARLLSRFVRVCLSNPGMRQLQRDEGELAFRLQTPVPLDDLAYTAVRIVESYVHRAAITGDEPDAERAARVLHALLR
jgi:AcrR family transcriptional regulator